MNALHTLLARLEDHDFKVEKRTELFGEPLPNLRAIAIDQWAHQLVLMAEEPESSGGDEGESDQEWRELIFAVAGMRHHLRGAGLPALGSPVLLALVDDEGKARLRGLVEEIARSYALFSRVDINIVLRRDAGKTEALDSALSSLLPRLRQTIKDKRTVAARDVEEFWEELSQEIGRSADGLAQVFGSEIAAESRQQIWQALKERPDDEDGPEGMVSPISRIVLDNFRSFSHEEVKFPAVTIVQGANGSGKTSLCEAMEIAWSGRSRRIPEGVKAKFYEKHLRRNGKDFRLACDLEGQSEPVTVDGITDFPQISLGRAVMPQHAVDEMAGSSPQDRFRAFLLTSGLDLPDFEERVVKIRKDMHAEACAALARVGIERIRAVNVPGLKHLEMSLQSEFAAQFPSEIEVMGAVEALSRISNGAFLNRSPLRAEPASLHALVNDADSALSEVRLRLDGAPDPVPAVRAAVEALNSESEYLTRRGVALQQILEHLRVPESAAPEQEAIPPPAPPVPARIAARWLANVRGIERAVPELEAMESEIEDRLWRGRLDRYAEALRQAVDISSAQELEAITEAEHETARPPAPKAEKLPQHLSQAAGFVRAPDQSAATVAAIEELRRRMDEYGAELGRLASRLKSHPGVSFSGMAPRVLRALCDFELAREIAKPTGAVTRARGTLVSRLLDDRLAPVVRELVAAFTRFEWYFEEPLGIAVEGRELKMYGLSSPDPDLDIRMLLNEAERTVVGIAWFLALHALQAKEHRPVLVLDDPASGFDETNKAAFVATLRSALHLLKPEQFLITTHDDSLLAQLEQEMGEVGGWPTEVGVLRCRRRSDGSSTVSKPDSTRPPEITDLAHELRLLNLKEHDSQAPA
ncbi:MAG TPA: AAA family ATPase [Solirubrobacterales bacterium]